MIVWSWTKKGETLLKSSKRKPINPPPIKKEKTYKFVNENKREKTSKRMSERELTTNRHINPFHNKNNYIRDISIQDTYLRPQNSNFGK